MSIVVKSGENYRKEKQPEENLPNLEKKDVFGVSLSQCGSSFPIPSKSMSNIIWRLKNRVLTKNCVRFEDRKGNRLKWGEQTIFGQDVSTVLYSYNSRWY